MNAFPPVVTPPQIPGYYMSAAKLVPFLERVGFEPLNSFGHTVCCVDVDGDPVGDCTGCPGTAENHAGFCLVSTVYRKDPDDPDSPLVGFDDALCFAGLASYLRVTQATTDGFEAFHIEIPRPVGGAQ